ncbi:MAG: response regulator [Chlamydiae bacterium]|nr:response regulator [Chlamydiota bacterium]MBI3276493.1 response regulator [Chlamydiota bacterium]
MSKSHPKKKALKILIIDDDQAIALILKEFLQMKEYRVSYATEVEDVDGLILEERPDVVFLDYRMSPLTGKDILEKITLFDEEIPVVMMSAYRTSEGMFEVRKLGAFDYIGKPFNFDEIDSILAKLE